MCQSGGWEIVPALPARQTLLGGAETSSFPHLLCSLAVGEEIEMTPMVFAKGLADSGCWGDKLFGRLVSEELRGGGHGYGLRKASQAKVIYGLEPIFESGRTCVIKVSSLLVFGPSSETSLLGRNYDVTIQVPCPIPHPSFHCQLLPFPSLGLLGSPVWTEALSANLTRLLGQVLRRAWLCLWGHSFPKPYFHSRNLSRCLHTYLARSLCMR